MMSAPEQHREKTGDDELIPQPHGGALRKPWKPGIPSPNPKGRAPIRRLTDAFLKLLDEADNEAEFVRAWFEMIVVERDSAALREALTRIEGHVPKDTQRELPKITLNVQTVQNSVTGQPVPLPGQPSPALHAVEVEATPVEIAPFVDPDEDGDDE